MGEETRRRMEVDKPDPRQIEILRRMAPYQRLRQAFALYDFARRRVVAHIHSRHPELSEEEVKALVRERFSR